MLYSAKGTRRWEVPFDRQRNETTGVDTFQCDASRRLVAGVYREMYPIAPSQWEQLTTEEKDNKKLTRKK